MDDGERDRDEEMIHVRSFGLDEAEYDAICAITDAFRTLRDGDYIKEEAVPDLLPVLWNNSTLTVDDDVAMENNLEYYSKVHTVKSLQEIEDANYLKNALAAIKSLPDKDRTAAMEIILKNELSKRRK